MPHQLGSLALRVYGSQPFQYTDPLVQRTRLIGDGTNDTNNEVLQSGALPNRVAVYAVRVYSAADLDTLQGFYADQDTLAFTDRRELTHWVKVTGLQVNEVQWHWEATVELTELTPPFEAS